MNELINSINRLNEDAMQPRHDLPPPKCHPASYIAEVKERNHLIHFCAACGTTLFKKPIAR